MLIKFKHNMNSLDRTLRAVVGLSLLILGPLTEFLTPDILSIVLMGIAGTIAFTSSLFSYCILYDMTGINTIRNSAKDSDEK